MAVAVTRLGLRLRLTLAQTIKTPRHHPSLTAGSSTAEHQPYNPNPTHLQPNLHRLTSRIVLLFREQSEGKLNKAAKASRAVRRLNIKLPYVPP